MVALPFPQCQATVGVLAVTRLNVISVTARAGSGPGGWIIRKRRDIGSDAIDARSRTRRSRGDGRATIADVAARAGVGAITVSRALRNPAQVSATLRALIDEAIRELNYVPDLHARALASSRTDVLAVLVPSLSHSVFTDVLRGIYDGVDGSTLNVQLGNTRFDPAEEERLLSGFVRQRPSAIIVSGVDQTPASRRMLEEAGCPVVQIMDMTHDPIQVVIGFRHREAGRRMTEHLIRQGYRRIAYISGWMGGRSLERLQGYQDALAAAGLSEPCRAHSLSKAELTALASRADPGVPPFLEFSGPSLGREMFRRARELAPGLDAVFCNNDSLALGVLFECQAQGIRVPQDMGIVGFNDLDFMDACHPSLSSVRTHRYRNGHAAVTAVQQMLQGIYDGPRVVDLGVELMIRESSLRHGLDGA
jgi:LacI family gluconate utilization system Gnt-I transcriptional repressor